MPNLQLIVDAPTTLLGEGEAKTSRVQVAKIGEKFTDPRYGKFAITQAHFDKWIENLAALHLADGRLGVPVDEDHGPEKRGDTKATGWLKALDQLGEDGKTVTADQLWATIDWNARGVELIEGKVYGYLSPSYSHDYIDEVGKHWGTTLVGVGLTNRPFLRMAAVSLSAAPVDAEYEGPDGRQTVRLQPPAPAPSDSPRRMSFLDDTRKALNLSADLSEEQVLEAVRAAASPPAPKPGDTTTLAEQAKAQGLVVLSSDDHTSLVADATAGAQAAKTLHEQRFDGAWKGAEEAGRAVPAMREQFVTLYEANADATLKAIEGLPVIIDLDAVRGHGNEEGEPSVDPGERTLAEGHPIDEDRAKLDARAKALMRDGKAKDYGEAITLASAGAVS